MSPSLRGGPPTPPLWLQWAESGKIEIWNCILHDLFRNTPLDHVWRAQIGAQICTQIRPNTPRYFWCVFGCIKCGRVGYPRRDLANCSSVALIFGQKDSLNKKVMTKSHVC